MKLFTLIPKHPVLLWVKTMDYTIFLAWILVWEPSNPACYSGTSSHMYIDTSCDLLHRLINYYTPTAAQPVTRPHQPASF